MFALLLCDYLILFFSTFLPFVRSACCVFTMIIPHYFVWWSSVWVCFSSVSMYMNAKSRTYVTCVRTGFLNFFSADPILLGGYGDPLYNPVREEILCSINVIKYKGFGDNTVCFNLFNGYWMQFVFHNFDLTSLITNVMDASACLL